MKSYKLLWRGTAWLLVLTLLLASCAPSAVQGTTMKLAKIEGKVRVSDSEGRDLTPEENLGLYSGCGVDTRSKSYAWISLDDTKLVKMDQKSEIVLEKREKDLEIQVLSGSLFFNVTEPLADDETMEIQTSTMTVDIRGTCGWVEVLDEDHINLYLLEGEVECAARRNAVTVTAGEMAAMAADGEIAVTTFTALDVPDFVVEEIEKDDRLARDILDDSGIDVLSPAQPDPLADALEQYRAIVSQPESYFPYDEYAQPTGDYRYILVQMHTQNEIPSLLLEQDTTFGISIILVFQYNPDSKTAEQANGSLQEGVGSAGGYRGSLFVAGDGEGLLSTEWSSGSGEGLTQRITLEGNSLRTDTLWEGNIFDDTDWTSEEIGLETIEWHDIGDLSGLDSWTPQ